MNSKNPFRTSRSRPTIAGTGLVALDIVIVAACPESQRLYAGGTCGNVMTIMSWFGWDSYPVSRLGSDRARETVLRDMRRWGVNTKLASLEPGAATPVVVEKIARSVSDNPSHRFAWTCPSCGAWLPGYRAIVASCVATVKSAVPDADVFFFDRVSRAAVNLARWYCENGAWVVFEPSATGDQKQFREALKYVHVLKYSDERMNEMSGLTGTNRPLLQVETQGSEGLRYRIGGKAAARDGWKSLPRCPVASVLDTAGAGDWCTAGLIHLLQQLGQPGSAKLTQSNVKEALRFGQALAAWTCQFGGPRGGMYKQPKDVIEAEVNHLLFGHEMDISGLRTGRVKRSTEITCVSGTCNSARRSARQTAKS